MSKAIGDDEAKLGFTLLPAKSRRIKPVSITDADFADDIALLLNDIRQADELLKRVECSVQKLGLHTNETKTEVKQHLVLLFYITNYGFYLIKITKDI